MLFTVFENISEGLLLVSITLLEVSKCPKRFVCLQTTDNSSDTKKHFSFTERFKGLKFFIDIRLHSLDSLYKLALSYRKRCTLYSNRILLIQFTQRNYFNHILFPDTFKQLTEQSINKMTAGELILSKCSIFTLTFLVN